MMNMFNCDNLRCFSIDDTFYRLEIGHSNKSFGMTYENDARLTGNVFKKLNVIAAVEVDRMYCAQVSKIGYNTVNYYNFIGKFLSNLKNN